MTEPQQHRDVAVRQGWLALPDRYRKELWYQPDRHTRLIPRDDLAPLIQVLEHRLRPATSKELAGALSLITAAWQGYDRLEPKIAAAHLRLLREDLAAFPAAVLAETIAELRKTLRFTPSIAEFYQLASTMVEPDRRQLRMAQQHLEEHERRATEARAEAERQAERRRKQEARIARLARIYGAAWPSCTPEQLDASWEGMFAVGLTPAVEWSWALDAGEPWAAHVLPLAAVAGCVFVLLRTRKITEAEASQLVLLIRSDLDRACNLVGAIETGNAPVGWANMDPTMVWDYASRVFGDFVDELRCRADAPNP